MRILLLDIETSPNTAHVWGLWQQNVGITQLLESSYTLCWSAKWFGENEIFFDSIYHSKPKKMLKKIHSLLEEADAVVHYNGTKFDIPTLNKEFLLYGLKPPAPYKQIDLLKIARNRFKFPSNRLDYVSQQLGLGKKTNTTHELWIKCMNNDPEAWEQMQEYNMNDVILLEKVYNKFLPWLYGTANHGLYDDNSLVCPNCGSGDYQHRGYAYTKVQKYARFQCKKCGSWFRSNKTELAGNEPKLIGIN